MEKQCPRCQKIKSIDNFGINVTMPDGYSYWCKKCKCDSQKNYRHRMVAKAFAANELSARQKYRRSNRHKAHANLLVHRALESGKINKPDYCAKCFKKGVVEAHHTDYSKPLDVVWLCVCCHKRAHRILEAQRA